MFPVELVDFLVSGCDTPVILILRQLSQLWMQVVDKRLITNCDSEVKSFILKEWVKTKDVDVIVELSQLLPFSIYDVHQAGLIRALISADWFEGYLWLRSKDFFAPHWQPEQLRKIGDVYYFQYCNRFSFVKNLVTQPCRLMYRQSKEVVMWLLDHNLIESLCCQSKTALSYGDVRLVNMILADGKTDLRWKDFRHCLRARDVDYLNYCRKLLSPFSICSNNVLMRLLRKALHLNYKDGFLWLLYNCHSHLIDFSNVEFLRQLTEFCDLDFVKCYLKHVNPDKFNWPEFLNQAVENARLDILQHFFTEHSNVHLEVTVMNTTCLGVSFEITQLLVNHFTFPRNYYLESLGEAMNRKDDDLFQWLLTWMIQDGLRFSNELEFLPYIPECGSVSGRCFSLIRQHVTISEFTYDSLLLNAIVTGNRSLLECLNPSCEHLLAQFGSKTSSFAIHIATLEWAKTHLKAEYSCHTSPINCALKQYSKGYYAHNLKRALQLFPEAKSNPDMVDFWQTDIKNFQFAIQRFLVEGGLVDVHVCTQKNPWIPPYNEFTVLSAYWNSLLK